MIGADYVRLMARYSTWQNRSLFAATGTLDDAARNADRGAFFGSVHATLSHLLWADMTWMHRFSGSPPPPGSHANSPQAFPDWEAMVAARSTVDRQIEGWAAGLSDADLAGEAVLSQGAAARALDKLVVHFFNHQTHHRGQVHAMLTAAGAWPDDTDLMLLDD